MNLEELLKTAEKDFGPGTLMISSVASQPTEKLTVVRTGSYSLDDVLGVGGFPLGKIVEITGMEAGGKTTLCLHTIANAQKMGYKCAFIDAEHALDKRRVEAIGVNFGDLIISQPDSGEQALEIAEFLIRNDVKVVVIDSVAALTPRSEIESEMGTAQMGAQARLIGQGMRKLTAPANKNQCLLIFTNQIRHKIGGWGSAPIETTPGGNAVKFYASIRLDVRKVKGDSPEGTTHHRIRIKKNKLAPPFGEVEIDIGVNGIEMELDLFNLCLKRNLVTQNGSFIKKGGKVLAQGKQAFIDLLKNQKELRETLISEAFSL